MIPHHFWHKNTTPVTVAFVRTTSTSLRLVLIIEVECVNRQVHNMWAHPVHNFGCANPSELFVHCALVHSCRGLFRCFESAWSSWSWMSSRFCCTRVIRGSISISWEFSCSAVPSRTWSTPDNCIRWSVVYRLWLWSWWVSITTKGILQRLFSVHLCAQSCQNG